MRASAAASARAEPWLSALSSVSAGASVRLLLGERLLSLLGAMLLGARVRETGCVVVMARLLCDPAVDIPTREMVLYVLSNLCSDSFEAASGLTKQALLESDGTAALMGLARRTLSR